MKISNLDMIDIARMEAFYTYVDIFVYRYRVR